MTSKRDRIGDRRPGPAVRPGLVGDGYTSAELGLYHDHVLGKWAELAAVEPFKSYRQYFNVWQVDVVSNQSGVDHDPALGTDRDTALDMDFWCQGLYRPTENSIMRTLGREFNPVGRDAMVEAFKAKVPELR